MDIKSKTSELFYLSAVICEQLENLEKEMRKHGNLFSQILKAYPSLSNSFRCKNILMRALKEA